MACDSIDLPLEIHELILDHFSMPPPSLDWYDRDSPQSAENRGTLRAYSMVSRSFCIAAKSRLFSSVVMDLQFISRNVNLRKATSDIRRFIAMAQDSLKFPNLGMIYHIQSFALTIWMDSTPARANKFLQASNVYRLLDILHGPSHGVECLALCLSLDKGKFKLEYTAIDHNLRHAFHDIFRSPNLKYLQLTGFFGVPNFILCNPNYKILELYDTEIMYLAIPQITSTVKSTPLDESEPRTLYLEMKWTGTRNLINVAFSAAQNLNILHIQLFGEWLQRFVYRDRFTMNPIPLYLLPRLSSLRIFSKNLRLDLTNAVVPFARVLQSCALPQSLKMLSVETVVVCSDLLDFGPRQARYEQWDVVGSVLAQPEFLVIPKVHITIQYELPCVDDSELRYIANLQRKVRRYISGVLPEFLKSKSKTTHHGLDLIFTQGVQENVNTSSQYGQNYEDANFSQSQLSFKCGGKGRFGIPSYEQ